MPGDSKAVEAYGTALIVVLLIVVVWTLLFPFEQRVRERKHHTNPKPIAERVGEAVGKAGADFVPGAVKGAAERIKERQKP